MEKEKENENQFAVNENQSALCGCSACMADREVSANVSSASGTEVITAPWSPAAFGAENVDVMVPISGWQAEVWHEVLSYVDAIIDKDFNYMIGDSDIAVSHRNLPRGVVGQADSVDGDIWNGDFVISIDLDLFNYIVAREGLVARDWYKFVAQHELGHALGLKHPFDGWPVNMDYDLSDTVMAYGYDSVGFTDLDRAALIAVNGIEDDLVDGKSPVFRFYNKEKASHFYTADVAEAEWLAIEHHDTFSFEGAGYYAGKGESDVHRFYNKVTGGHFFTASSEEASYVIDSLSEYLIYEGTAHEANISGNGLGVHRFFNVDAGGHFFTASQEEADYVVAELSGSHIYEGVAFWV